MLEDSLRVNVSELPRIRDSLQDLRQVMRCLNSIHGRRLKSASRGVLKAKSLKNRDDIIAQPRPDVTGVRNTQNHPPHRQASSKSASVKQMPLSRA
jgi:hypothetical protein